MTTSSSAVYRNLPEFTGRRTWHYMGAVLCVRVNVHNYMYRSPAVHSSLRFHAHRQILHATDVVGRQCGSPVRPDWTVIFLCVS